MRSCSLCLAILALASLLMGPGLCQANPVPVGACCLDGGGCQELDPFSCWGLGGVWRGEPLCDPNPCVGPTGACCFPDGTCQVLSEEQCQQPTGVYLGPAYVCEPCNPCVQCLAACCVVEVCYLMPCYNCCIAGFDLHMGAECQPNPCVPTPTQELSWGRIKQVYR